MLGEQEIAKALDEAKALLQEMKAAHGQEINTWLARQNELTQKIQIRVNELKDIEKKQEGKIEALEDILGIKKDDAGNNESKPVASA